MDTEFKRALKVSAHALKPVIIIGQHGFSEAVLKELQIALTHHELIKIKLPALDKEGRTLVVEEILTKTGAALVQSMGRIVTIYKEGRDELSRAPTQKTSKNQRAKRTRSRN